MTATARCSTPTASPPRYSGSPSQDCGASRWPPSSPSPKDVRERDGLRQFGRQLEEAFASRAEIDQAKGIIMARHGCSADEAFARLVTVSRNTNTKLSDLSARLVRGAVRPRPASR
ncbi:MAG: ANTAR domain-containing protein [Geodermatophilaceae bacterium]|nr:ANTAR domain-containing protein [Geodermatophilaceae bacterium]